MADQADGLRRRSTLHVPRHLHFFSTAASSAQRLAESLHQHGATPLLIDAGGRLFGGSTPRSLFDWHQQLARDQFQLLALPAARSWFAPGVRGDESGLQRLTHDHDPLLFARGIDDSGWALMPGARHFVALQVELDGTSVQRAYAILKTLAHAPDAVPVFLLGETLACGRLLDAARRFLAPAFCRTVTSVAEEDDAFAALAVRMADEETDLSARYKTGNT